MRRLILILALILIASAVKFTSINNHVTSIPKNPLIENISSSVAEQKIVLGQKIDINKASLHDLTVLPGIGPKLALNIILKREELGRFNSISDLESVFGIGPKKLAKICRYIDTY